MATTVQQSVITMATEILRAAGRVVVWDYQGKEIPDALTRAGLSVTIYLAYLDTPDILEAARELGRTSRRRSGIGSRPAGRRRMSVAMMSAGSGSDPGVPVRSAWATVVPSGLGPTPGRVVKSRSLPHTHPQEDRSPERLASIDAAGRPHPV